MKFYAKPIKICQVVICLMKKHKNVGNRFLVGAKENLGGIYFYFGA